MQDFRKLAVWEKAHHLTLEIYKVTSSFPKDELFGLTSQTRGACASIPANIAEGCGRGSRGELARFLQIASGSAAELEYHLLLGHDLNLIKTNDYEQMASDLIEIRRMLNRLTQKVKQVNSTNN